MTSEAENTRSPAEPGAIWYPIVFVVALAVRLLYAAALDIPPYDPWRHLLLTEACRTGSGFSLFAGQPYAWYQPLWHPFAALWPAALGAAFPAAVLGALQASLWLPLARALAPERGRLTALAAALGVACFGPLVRHTVHFGPEAFALCLVSLGLLLQAGRTGRLGAGLGGVLFGIGTLARLNLGPLALLALPLARTRGRAAIFSAGVALPLLAGWWRNRAILDRFEWLFSWDGLAVRTDGFGLAATLMPQRHPEIATALTRLHEQIVSVPEWFRDAGGIRWETIALLILGIVALGLARHAALTAAAAVLFGYLLILDSTGSSNFFRLYLPLFPLLLTALAIAGARLAGDGRARSVVLVVVALLLGAPSFVPPPAPTLEHVVPRSGTFDDGRTYAVTSGLYHPEALAYAFPSAAFVGLPLMPDALDSFLEAHPQIDALVVHDFTVQPELVREIERRYGPPTRVSTNGGGYSHRVYALRRVD